VCLFSVFAVSGVYAQTYGGGANGCCDQCCPCEQACGECYCRYVKYYPQQYCTSRCICEQVPCCKTCYRYVPRYYQVQKCRYVPQYWCETYCKPECQSYQVPDCKYRTRTICEPHCRWIPRYFWKHECKPCCNPTAPPCS